MKLTLIREIFTDKTTIGSLFIDGKFFCYTLEDKDRGLTSDMTLEEIKKIKVYGETAIPLGSYKLILNASPKFNRVLPRLQEVKGYEGVLIHRGNYAKDTLGCILVGKEKSKDNQSILYSTDKELELVKLLSNQKDITLEIVKVKES